MSSHFPCACGECVPAAALLESAAGYDEGLGTLNTACPRCGEWLTVRPRGGQVEVGFGYSAGGPHFEAMATVEAHGLTVREREDDVLELVLDSRRWEHALAPREQWLWIRPGDFALGKALHALGVPETGVELLALDANDGVELPLETPEPLSHRHRIRVRGSSAARRRAAKRLATGG